jgi:hypothetical protein
VNLYIYITVSDVLPDPPDGPPVIEAVTGKTITLCWKKPRRLDPSIGHFLFTGITVIQYNMDCGAMVSCISRA